MKTIVPNLQRTDQTDCDCGKRSVNQPTLGAHDPLPNVALKEIWQAVGLAGKWLAFAFWQNEIMFVDIVFDGPPGPESGRFVEVENEHGRSVNLVVPEN